MRTLILVLMALPMMAADYDVVVVGATPGGIAAAVNAGDAGMQVLLCEPSAHIGGLTAGGLSNTDFKSFQGLGGTWRDFMDRVVAYYRTTYGPESQQVEDCRDGGWYEPHVAELLFHDMLDEAGVTLWTQHRLLAAAVDTSGARDRITAVTLRDTTGDPAVETTVTGTVFIDGTYEGDLLAAAGAAFELRSVQSYNYRVVMSTDPDNQIPFADVQPALYDAMDFSALRQLLLEDEPDRGLSWLIKIRMMPNDKAEWNDISRRPFHFSIPGDGWSTSSPAYRAQMEAWARATAEGMFHFLATDPDLAGHPIQGEIQDWGYAADEFTDNGNFPHALYVREGRRLHGVYVMGVHDQRQDATSSRAPLNTAAIAIADYPSSAHGNYNDYGIDAEDFGPATGDFSTTGRVNSATRGDPGDPDPDDYPSVGNLPYQIPYGSIVPVAVDGLLAPVPMSAEGRAFVSIRMEPTWTALGQAAGLAAAQAIDGGIALRDVDVERLQRRLHARGGMTYFTADVGEDSPYFAAVQYLGTRAGLFHDTNLISSDTRYDAPVSLADTQWSHAPKWHDVQPALTLTAAVADAWLARCEATFGPGSVPAGALEVDGTRTRGDALLALYRALPAWRSIEIQRVDGRHWEHRDADGERSETDDATLFEYLAPGTAHAFGVVPGNAG